MDNEQLPPFSCTHSPEFPELLRELGCSLLISTYQTGKIIILSALPQGGLIQLPRTFDKPMGVAWRQGQIAVATRNELIILANAPSLARSFPDSPNIYDALFIPRAVYFAGEMDLHDMAWGRDDELWAVNTRCNCLCVIESGHNFVPRWRPFFVPDLIPEDRCHLNGLAMQDGEPLFATALGQSTEPGGWRANKATGGILFHVPSNEILASGLSMPHSPRLIDGELYVLNSGTGELLRVDQSTGKTESIIALPGFGRGLSRYKDFLFIGLSQLRSNRTFSEIPLEKRVNELLCGVAVVHLPSAKCVATFWYLNTCTELYDVHVLPQMRRPGILGIEDNTHKRALSLPEAGFWSNPLPETPQPVSP